MNSISEEGKKEIHDQCFAKWVTDIDPGAKSSDITGIFCLFNVFIG